MTLKLFLTATSLHTGITPCLRKCQLHRFFEKLETLHLIDRLLCALCRVEHNECLTLSFQIRLRDNVDDFAIFAEELSERLFELAGL